MGHKGICLGDSFRQSCRCLKIVLNIEEEKKASKEILYSLVHIFLPYHIPFICRKMLKMTSFLELCDLQNLCIAMVAPF